MDVFPHRTNPARNAAFAGFYSGALRKTASKRDGHKAVCQRSIVTTPRSNLPSRSLSKSALILASGMTSDSSRSTGRMLHVRGYRRGADGWSRFALGRDLSIALAP